MLAGQPLPALPWSLDGETGEVVVDYYGTPIRVTLTEEGMDMNYFDSMMLHMK